MLMKPIKYIFKSLFNNSLIIEGRKRKGLEALIVFILAMIIALIPSTVSIASVKGSAFMNSNINGVDTALVEFSKEMNTKGIKFTVAQEEKQRVLNVSQDDMTKWDYADGYFKTEGYDGEKLKERLRVYLMADKTTDDITEKVKALQAQTYDAEKEVSNENVPMVSYMIIGKDITYISIYTKSATEWKSPTATRYFNYNSVDTGEIISNYTGEHALENWKTFFDKGYQSIKVNTLFAQIGLLAGINALVSLFMALMIFIFTRGKKNPFRDYKFTEALKIVGIASLAPSLLACLFGFILPQQFSTMAFMILLGIRIMWMTSKNLNPAVMANN